MGSVMVPVWSAVPSWVPWVMNLVLLLVGIFLILLVLIQRGKGGGLAGAFGGAGGSSAFGSRAGDTFTRVTIYVAAVWILLIMFLIKMVQPIDAKPTGEPIITKQEPTPVPVPEGE
jgi:preprotein translocase subunit SecG